MKNMMRSATSSTTDQRGVALLAVLWLTVALTFVGMATAQLVRTEVEAVGNRMDSQRGYYLAQGGMEAAVYAIAHSTNVPASPASGGDSLPRFSAGMRWLQYPFANGACTVEIVPENAKLSVNSTTAEQLTALFATLGLNPVEAIETAAAIVHWRSPRSSDAGGPLDLYYAALPQPYAARHATLDELEELLPVRGISRSLFFGRYERSANGHWRKWPALADLLSTAEGVGVVNPNYAPFEVLRSLPGWSDEMASSVITARSRAPFRTMEELQAAAPQIAALTGVAPITLAASPVYTLTATGLVSGSAVRRSVRALVTISAGLPLEHQILGWWDDWPTPADLPQEIGGRS